MGSDRVDEYFSDIKEYANKMTDEQLSFFSWVCLIRSFPLIKYFSDITNYNIDSEYQEYLYSLFYAIDTSINLIIKCQSGLDTLSCVNDLVVALQAACRALHILTDVLNNSRLNAKNGLDTVLKNACVTIKSAINSANDSIDKAIQIALDATLSTRTDKNAYAAAEIIDALDSINKDYVQEEVNDPLTVNTFIDSICNDGGKHKIYCIQVLQKDAQDILHGKTKLKSTVQEYNEMWNGFINRLSECDCRYWASYYQKLNKDELQYDKDLAEILNKHVSILREIQIEGAAKVGKYLQKINEQGVESLNQARILILGEKGAGKTCLARRLIDPDAPMTNDIESTEGIETTIWEIPYTDGNKINHIKAHIWDFAGHVVTHAAHRCFLSERCLYIIVYDSRTESRNNLEYWLDHVKLYGHNSDTLILVNKRDNNIPIIKKNTLMEKYPFILGFHYLSIQDDRENIIEFSDLVERYIINNPSWNAMQIPKKYFYVKQEVERRFSQQNGERWEHIEKEEFINIALGADISADEAYHVLEDLHALGICLWYPELDKFNTLVLNPEWITYGIYRLINWGRNNEKYIISLSDYQNIFQNNEQKRYPLKKFPYLFNLMKCYELAFSKSNSDSITIPLLMKSDRPVKDSIPNFPSNSLQMEYVAEQPLPVDSIARLIVRHHDMLNDERLAWRSGVVLHFQDTIALIEEMDWRLSVRVKGPQQTELISILRRTLNDIFDSYTTKRPESNYKVISDNNIIHDSRLMNNNNSISGIHNPSYMIPEVNLFAHYKKNQPILNPHTYEYQNPNSIINLYFINIDNYFGGNLEGDIITNTYNYHDFNIGLQGDLNTLKNIFAKNNFSDEYGVNDLKEELKSIEKATDKDDIVRSGVLNRLKYFIDDALDENSSINKKIKKAKDGARVLQSIANKYNAIAQWIGLPQIPKPLLNIV